MPVTTVQSYLQAQLDGLVIPTVAGYTSPPLVAIISPPTVGSGASPTVYIKATRWQEKRLSFPPGSGTKQRLYQRIDIVVRYIINTGQLPAGVTAMTLFSAVVDAVTNKLDTLPKSVKAQDPLTGTWSTLGLIGDTQSGGIEGPFALQDQRQQLFGAPLVCELKELFTG